MTSQLGDASLIRAGAGAIAGWRAANPAASIASAGTEFKKLDLSGCDLSGANLRRCCFSACDLRHCNFANALLAGARFFDCDLTASNFSNADLWGVALVGVKLDDVCFDRAHALGRLSALRVSVSPARPPSYDRNSVPIIDRWIGWDRLRFLATIRIFVPAYASLTLSVLYLTSISWYNEVIERIDDATLRLLPGAHFPGLPKISSSWWHIAVTVDFLLLALAATSFLGCPSRIIEFSRERWLSEIHGPELLYDHAAWQRPLLRCICVASLGLGGALSGFLLVRGIVSQIYFIVDHTN